MTSIFLMVTTKIFLSFFNLAPKNFCVFIQPQIDFRIQTNIFCVYNVVLDILILDVFFLFSSKTLKTPFSFGRHGFVCLDQCLVI